MSKTYEIGHVVSGKGEEKVTITLYSDHTLVVEPDEVYSQVAAYLKKYNEEKYGPEDGFWGYGFLHDIADKTGGKLTIVTQPKGGREKNGRLRVY